MFRFFFLRLRGLLFLANFLLFMLPFRVIRLFVFLSCHLLFLPFRASVVPAVSVPWNGRDRSSVAGMYDDAAVPQ